MTGAPPWLQRQLAALRQQQGHALLLAGPPGLGQYPLALELARTWLCEQPGEAGSCGACGSCHAIDVRTHADLLVLMPDALALELGWPLDPKTQDRIDKKEIKPSKFIRVEPTREAVAFTQLTAARGGLHVILIFPADRLNVESANALLKTLEEPPGHTRFILATEAAHALLPTIRSRCLTHTLQWPRPDEALSWLAQQHPAADRATLQVALRAAGERPDMAEAWLASGMSPKDWAGLPKQIQQGQWDSLREWPAASQMDVLMKLCHDLMVVRAGGPPRYFDRRDLPEPPTMASLERWRSDLMAAARTMEHPFSAPLMQDAWALRAQQALAVHSTA